MSQVKCLALSYRTVATGILTTAQLTVHRHEGNGASQLNSHRPVPKTLFSISGLVARNYNQSYNVKTIYRLSRRVSLLCNREIHNT